MYYIYIYLSHTHSTYTHPHNTDRRRKLIWTISDLDQAQKTCIAVFVDFSAELLCERSGQGSADRWFLLHGGLFGTAWSWSPATTHLPADWQGWQFAPLWGASFSRGGRIKEVNRSHESSSEVCFKGFHGLAELESKWDRMGYVMWRKGAVKSPYLFVYLLLSATICIYIAFGLRFCFNFAGISAFATCKVCSRRWSMAGLPRRSADNVLVPFARQSRDVC